LVSIDAIGCQKAIAEQVRARGGDYVLAVKGNQERLLEGPRSFTDVRPP
jgi:predicted transposase YbfD/YdcC